GLPRPTVRIYAIASRGLGTRTPYLRATFGGSLFLFAPLRALRASQRASCAAPVQVGRGMRTSSRHHVVQLVPRVERGRRELSLRGLGHQLLEDGVQLLVDEALALLARLPDVEDAKDTVRRVESGGVRDQPVGRAAQVEGVCDGVVVGRARVAVDDVELLDVRDRHA